MRLIEMKEINLTEIKKERTDKKSVQQNSLKSDFSEYIRLLNKNEFSLLYR